MPSSRETRVGTVAMATKWSREHRAALVVISLIAVWQAYVGFTVMTETIESAAVRLGLTLLFFVAVALWLNADRKKYPAISDQYHGFAVLVFWPVVLPFYIVQSRGWRSFGRIVLVACIAWVAGTVVGMIAGGILLALTRVTGV